MSKFTTGFQVRKSWDTAILALLAAVIIMASLTTENFLTALNILIFSQTQVKLQLLLLLCYL